MPELITFNEITFECKTFGAGKEILFAFHGFNRDADDFRVLEPSLGKKYKIVSFNLFFYGQSSVAKPNNYAVHYSDLKGLINVYLQKYDVHEFSLMGYSLGGRLALAFTELFPEQVKNVYLLAPDGIIISSWYKLAIRSKIGQELYKRIINKPRIFFKIADYLRNRRYISDGLYNFACYHMHTAERRQKVFDVWMALRKIIPDLRKVRRIIRAGNIRVYLILGRYDSVIPVRVGRKFAAGLEGKAEVKIVNTGHNLISYSTNSLLSEIIDEKRQ